MADPAAIVRLNTSLVAAYYDEGLVDMRAALVDGGDAHLRARAGQEVRLERTDTRRPHLPGPAHGNRPHRGPGAAPPGRRGRSAR